MTPTELLAAYDAQLRTDAETQSAITVERQGPLWLVTFDGGRGLVTYRDLAGADAGEIRDRVSAALEFFRGDPQFRTVEWKTRGHDHAPGLPAALVDHGFVPGDVESIMLGDLVDLIAEVPLPGGVSLRRVRDESDVRAMCAMQGEVFGGRPSEAVALAVLRRLALEDGMELWVAEVDGQIVCAGRLERWPAPMSRGSGAERPDRSGGGGGSIGRSRPRAPGRRWPWASGSPTATRRTSLDRFWNGPAW